MTDTTLPLTAADLVVIGLEAKSREVATRRLAELLKASGRVTDVDGFLEDVRARDEQMPTGLPGGIAFPHARSRHVAVPSVAIGVSREGVDYGADDGPATLIFLIGAPHGSHQMHLVILAHLARKLINDQFRRSLLAAEGPEQVAALIQSAVVLPDANPRNATV